MKTQAAVLLVAMFALASPDVWSTSTLPIVTPVPVIEAVRAHDLDSLIVLLELGADPDQIDVFSRTALHYAASSGLTKLAEALIRAGANVNAVDEDEFVPLMRAVQNGYPETVALLLEFGANANTRNAAGDSALDLARDNGSESMMRILGNGTK